ncbi:DNA cytosine methyltransferase [Marinospirillum insulare]|uniref:DNA cytosine methyltransferase n=1 Tax=Marinospirillum insulare TaxID=217169 RepID=UPI0009FE8898
MQCRRRNYRNTERVGAESNHTKFIITLVAGKQKATNDPLGVLYRDYIRHVNALKPKIVVMENVYGLAQVKSANMIEEIYKSFQDIGYDVTHRELMAADYGVPQKRRRLFFVAAKNLHYFQYPQPTHC